MSDGSQTSSDVSALVEALDARARQAGNDGAATLVRGVLGSLSESLTVLDERLDRIEASVAAGDGGRQAIDAVQQNLSALNGRLARLEEAFVQALEESGEGAVAVVDQVRAAVADALPAIGDLGASPAIRSGFSSLGERLDDLDQAIRQQREFVGERLTAIENAPIEVPLPPFPDPPDLEPLLSAIQSVEARVRAIEGGAGRAEPVDLAPVLGAVEGLAERLQRLEEREPPAVEIPPFPTPPDPPDLGPIVESIRRVDERVAGVETLVTTIESRPVPEPVAPRPAPEPVDFEPVIDRLRVLDGRLAALEARPEPVMPEIPVPEPVDVRPAMVDSLAPVLARITQLDEQVQRLADAPAPTLEPVADPAVLEKLAALEALLQRDQASTRLISAVEERVNAAVRTISDKIGSTGSDIASLRDQRDQVGRRLDEVAGAMTALRVEVEKAEGRSERHDERIDALASEIRETASRWPAVQSAQSEVQRVVADLSGAVAGLRPLLEEQRASVDRLKGIIAEVVAAMSTIDGRMQTLADRPEAAPPTDFVTASEVREVEARVADTVRREAELLTQRVASLAVGVEATRVMCEQIAEAAEQSLGRKAGEVGRRLAHDLGLRAKRQPTGRNERELGPGTNGD